MQRPRVHASSRSKVLVSNCRHALRHEWHKGGAAKAVSTTQMCCCCSLQVWHVKQGENSPPSYDHCHHAADAEGDDHHEDPCHQRRTVVRLHQFRTPLRTASGAGMPSESTAAVQCRTSHQGLPRTLLRPGSCAGHGNRKPAQAVAGHACRVQGNCADGHLQQSTGELGAVRCGTCLQESLPCTCRLGIAGQGACTGSAAPAV